MNVKVALAVLLLAPLLMGAKSGCLGWGQEPEVGVVDTYCLTAQKRQWSIEDSAETIREIDAENTTIDRRCGIKRLKT